MNANLQKAIDCLQIQDVYLHGSFAKCLNDFDPKYNNELEKLELQSKHIVKQSQVVALDNGPTFLRVFIDFGVRWVDSSKEDESESIQAIIEAEFISEYEIREELEETCIDEYVRKNASYHVWPYWREFLMNQCIRMHLPRLSLPTMQLVHHRHESNDAKQENPKLIP